MIGVSSALIPHEAHMIPTGSVPCAARPSTRFVHLDGSCRCFVGGPAPEFPPVVRILDPTVDDAS